MRMLLHICCAPCGGSCVERLLESDAEVRLYFSNSNLSTPEEFERRLASVRLLAQLYAVELEVDPYDHASWLRHVRGLESEPEHGRRCSQCFAWSLRRTALRAEELGMNFTTTLTVSPRKNSAAIFAAAAPFPSFVPWDFKKKDGYKRSCEIARLHGFYRQNFCGCEFSNHS